jgi:hypothetical protein
MLVFNFIYKVRKTLAIYLVNIVINTFRAYGFRKKSKRGEKIFDAGFIIEWCQAATK